MALDDRGFSREQFVDLTCDTEHISLYSSNTGFMDPTSYYQSEYDWQHAQNQSLSQQAHSHESERQYYLGHTEENITSNQAYSTCDQQSVSHTDFFPQIHAVWSSADLSDTLQKGQINQRHLFFPIDHDQQIAVQQPNATSNITGKPKRRRVQSHSQRKAANVRERRRMFHLNEAFDELRKRLPAFNYEKRLSRIETLRLAMTYISFMKEVSVGQDPKCVKLKPHGADLPPSNCSLLASPHPSFISSDNNDECNVMEESDCSNDELSNHSAENC